MELLTVRAAQSVFGVPMEDVQEIVDAWSVTPLPLLPDIFRGVTSLRGAAVPVADLTRLTGNVVDVPRRTMVILRTPVALLVDTVETVLEIDGIEPVDNAPPWVSGAAGHVQILNGRALLD